MTVSTLVSIINQLLPEPHAGLVAGILFGTKATLSPLLKDALITTSTLHIVALSGMNITILEGMIAALLVPIVGRRLSALLTVGCIAGFVWFVGVSPSVIRAAIMGTITLIALVFGRQTWSLLSLVLASAVMLLVTPGWIGELSFQLSVLATLGIILFGSEGQNIERAAQWFERPSNVIVLPITRPKEGVTRARASCDEPSLRSESGDGATGRASFRDRIEANRGTRERQDPVFRSITGVTEFKIAWRALFQYFYLLIKDDLRITLAAQVFTIPLIFYTFHRVSFISPVSNILIGFVIAPLTAVGLVMAAVGVVWLPLAVPFSWVVWVMAQYILGVVTWTAGIPFASLGF